MTLIEAKPAVDSSKRLAGKIALVTGGSRGIGAGIAQRLAQEGATVAVTYNKNGDAANQVVKDIEKAGGKALAIKADVALSGDADKLIAELKNAVGKIDILINNAGVFEGGSVEDIDIDQYQRIFDVNVKGVIATTIAALKILSNGGRIINISSGAAKVTMPGFSVYSASKAALDTLTRIWAQDLGSRKITVNSVAPGTTATDMYNQALNDEQKAAMIAKTALGRVGEPDDIAAVVAFLASDDGRWVTGSVISADGGINI